MAGKPVELLFITKKSIKGLEWSTRDGAPPVLAVSDSDPKTWDKVGTALSADFRVVAVNPESPYALVNAIWATSEPAIVIAEGPAACRTASYAAVVGTGAVRALVMVDSGDAAEQDWLAEIKVPTLVFRGRQSKVQSHEAAVALHELIRGSHLIEPEDCDGQPVKNSPGIVVDAIQWYIGSLGEGHMDYPVNGEPVDPKG